MAATIEAEKASDGAYPADWPFIAWAVKCMAGWKCERCGVQHGPIPNVLTVHHLDGDKWNMQTWNLTALCQRCHLRIQNRVKWEQGWWLPHSAWMARHVTEYNEWAARQGKPLHPLVGIVERDYSREWVR